MSLKITRKTSMNVLINGNLVEVPCDAHAYGVLTPILDGHGKLQEVTGMSSKCPEYISFDA